MFENLLLCLMSILYATLISAALIWFVWRCLEHMSVMATLILTIPAALLAAMFLAPIAALASFIAAFILTCALLIARKRLKVID